MEIHVCPILGRLWDRQDECLASSQSGAASGKGGGAARGGNVLPLDLVVFM